VSVEIPPSLQEGSDKKALIDACYFVIRVLRNATRGYQNPAVSSEPSADIRLLSERAVREIEAHEGMPIQDLQRDRINDYIALLEKFTRTTYQRSVGQDSERAASILSEMRASNPAD
jgi:hypothetical protein